MSLRSAPKKLGFWCRHGFHNYGEGRTFVKSIKRGHVIDKESWVKLICYSCGHESERPQYSLLSNHLWSEPDPDELQGESQ